MRTSTSSPGKTLMTVFSSPSFPSLVNVASSTEKQQRKETNINKRSSIPLSVLITYLFFTFIHQFVYLSIHPFISMCISLYIHSSVCVSLYTSIHQFVHLSIHPFISLCISLYIYSSVCVSLYTSIHQFVHLSIHPFISLCISLYVLPSVHPSLYISISIISPSIYPDLSQNLVWYYPMFCEVLSQLNPVHLSMLFHLCILVLT